MTPFDSTNPGDIEYDPDQDAYYATYDWGGEEPLRIFVARIVAEVADSSPTELGALYKSINPEALDEVFEPLPDGSTRAGGGVWFTLDDYRVTIHSDGAVEVAPLKND